MICYSKIQKYIIFNFYEHPLRLIYWTTNSEGEKKKKKGKLIGKGIKNPEPEKCIYHGRISVHSTSGSFYYSK